MLMRNLRADQKVLIEFLCKQGTDDNVTKGFNIVEIVKP